ncbi:MAG TPA: hypothetical protein VKU19_39525 [Bryobacteraceae bacterium]|nr:hypothetical protein [Bryobacteraceae bacterium]
MRSLGFLAVLLALAPGLSAQAWLFPKGDGTVTVLYQDNIERLHSFSDGRAQDKGHTYFDAVVVNSDFSLTDRLALSVSLPYMDGKYVGTHPHLLVRGQADTEVAIDNGSYHGGIQDFRLNVRYALTQHALKIVPFFQATIPSHDYPSFGHAAIGFDEREYRAGASVGRRLNPILSNAFVQGLYAFGYTPLVAANIAPKRSYGELQLGYLVNRRLSVQASSSLVYSHNGIDLDYNLFPGNLTEEQYLNHDRIGRSKLLDISGSAAYQINKSTNFFVSVGHSVYGRNTHLRYLVTTIGFTKAFTTRMSAESTSILEPLPDANKAMVCTCSKSK